MRKTFKLIHAFVGDENGATAIEYSLIAALIAVVIIATLLTLNDTMIELYEHLRSSIQPALEGAS